MLALALQTQGLQVAALCEDLGPVGRRDGACGVVGRAGILRLDRAAGQPCQVLLQHGLIGFDFHQLLASFRDGDIDIEDIGLQRPASGGLAADPRRAQLQAVLQRQDGLPLGLQC